MTVFWVLRSVFAPQFSNFSKFLSIKRFSMFLNSKVERSYLRILKTGSIWKILLHVKWLLRIFNYPMHTPSSTESFRHRITTVLSLFCFKRIKNVKIMQISNLSLSSSRLFLNVHLVFINSKQFIFN